MEQGEGRGEEGSVKMRLPIIKGIIHIIHVFSRKVIIKYAHKTRNSKMPFGGKLQVIYKVKKHEAYVMYHTLNILTGITILSLVKNYNVFSQINMF